MAYTPIALLKAYTNFHQDSDDLGIMYIDTAEAIVEKYLNYSPEYQQYTNVLNGNGGYVVSLKAKPVHILQEVIIDGVHIPVEQFYIANQFLHSREVQFPASRDRNVIVSYTAGYDTDSTPKSIYENDTVIDGGNAFSEYGDEEEGVGALIIPPIPKIITMTVLRIASILLSESDSNIGVTSKSFGDSGSRTFINYTNFDKYLSPLSSYRMVVI